MASAGELCTQCWAGSLQLQEGMLVCDVCGSIHQDFAEETQEYQAGISDARFFRKSESMKAQPRARAELEAPPPPPPVAEAVRAYVRSLQELLRRQAGVLVSACGVDAGLLTVLRELWLAFLAHSGLLEAATLLRLQALAEQKGDDDDGGGGGSGGGGEDGHPLVEAAGRKGLRSGPQMVYRKTLADRMATELAPKLRIQHTLALLLLACWQQGEAVSPLDVVRWALDGHLPYLSFPAEEGRGLEQYARIISHTLTVPTGVPSPKGLHQHAQQLAEQLGLACPPVSPALWLERYLAELDLPQALLPLAVQLHSVYQSGPLIPTAQCRPHHHPWALLMCSLLLAVKLCYGLDGTQRSMAGLPSAPDWQEWAQRQLSKLGSLSAFPLSSSEAAQLDEPGFRAYLQYLQRGLFASFAPPPDLQSVHQLFLRLALLDGSSDAGGSSVGGGSGSGGAGGEGRGERQQQQRQGVPGGAAPGLGARAGAGPGAGPGASAGAAGEHPAAGATDAGGPQAPPPHSSYHFYGTAKAGRLARATSGPFHPDYALLLIACAPLVWLLPETLHHLLAGLEQSVIGAECELSFLYNAQEQARLARLREEGAWMKRRKEEETQRRRQQKQEQQQQQQQQQEQSSAE